MLQRVNFPLGPSLVFVRAALGGFSGRNSAIHSPCTPRLGLLPSVVHLRFAASQGRSVSCASVQQRQFWEHHSRNTTSPPTPPITTTTTTIHLSPTFLYSGQSKKVGRVRKLLNTAFPLASSSSHALAPSKTRLGA